MKKAVNAVTFISLALAASVTYNIVQHQRAKGIRPGASSAPPASSELGAPGDPTTPIVESALKNNGSRFDSAANTPARISGDITFKSASYDRNDEPPFEGSRGTIAHHEEIKFRELHFSAAEIPETPADIVNSIKEKDDLPTLEIWRLLRRNKDMPDKVRAKNVAFEYVQKNSNHSVPGTV